MKIHATLTSDARRLLRDQSADELDAEGRALMGKLNRAGLKDINLRRAVRHGIVTGEVPEPRLAELRSLDEIASVEVDGIKRAL